MGGRSGSDRALVTLNAVAGTAALGGAWYALGGAPNVPTEWLHRSPIHSYKLPGLILGGIYAPASLTAAGAVWRRHPRAGELALAAGAIQVGWIAAQVAIIGYRSFLQPTMAAVGLIDAGLAYRRVRRRI